jgi:hypothetical protein
MMLSKITPRVLWITFIGAFCAAAVLRSGLLLGWWQRDDIPVASFLVLQAASYGFSATLCLKIANDHRSWPGMRWSWLLFCASSFASLIRHILEAVQSSRVIPDFRDSAAYVPVQLPMAIALVLLLAGLLCMWRSLMSLGLGFHPKLIDILVIMLMLLALPPILSRFEVQNPEFVRGWVVALPLAGAVLLPACGAIAVLLHRIATQMKGGALARVLSYLAWFPGIRLTAMLISFRPSLWLTPVLQVLDSSIYRTAPLVFALAVAYRWQITLKADAALERDIREWSELYPDEAHVA